MNPFWWEYVHIYMELLRHPLLVESFVRDFAPPEITSRLVFSTFRWVDDTDDHVVHGNGCLGAVICSCSFSSGQTCIVVLVVALDTRQDVMAPLCLNMMAASAMHGYTLICRDERQRKEDCQARDGEALPCLRGRTRPSLDLLLGTIAPAAASGRGCGPCRGLPRASLFGT